MKLGFCRPPSRKEAEKDVVQALSKLGLITLCCSLVRGYFFPRGHWALRGHSLSFQGCWVGGGGHLVMSEAIFGSHSGVERSYWPLGCCSVKVPRLRNLPSKI